MMAPSGLAMIVLTVDTSHSAAVVPVFVAVSLPKQNPRKRKAGQSSLSAATS